MVKGFALPVDYVLHDISYTNIVMMSATLPTYGSAGDKEKKKTKGADGEVVKADDRRNIGCVASILRQYN